MASVRVDGALIHIETDSVIATVRTEGYTTGVMGGSFVDKATGATDLGHGLAVVDYLLEPGVDDPTTPSELRYHHNDAIHGDLPKRYVALPQICTQAQKLPYEIVRGDGFVAIRQWFTWEIARPPYKPGSMWEQWLLFQDGVRYFLVCDRVTSTNDVDCLLLRVDMPGHLKHKGGDTFQNIYLSYGGLIPASDFENDFPPDSKFLYQRKPSAIPDRIRDVAKQKEGRKSPPTEFL